MVEFLGGIETTTNKVVNTKPLCNDIFVLPTLDMEISDKRF